MKQLHASFASALAALLLAAPVFAQPVKTPAIPGASAQVLPDFADLVEKYGGAVVNINTQARRSARQQLPGLDENDPKSMARWARRMGQELGEDMGDDFNEMVEQMEAGEMPDDDGEMGGGMGSGMDDFD